MIVLDTNVLSALMRRPPDTGVVEWLDKQPRTSIWTTSITILEIRYGLHILPIGKRRSALLQAFERVLVEKIENRTRDLCRDSALSFGNCLKLCDTDGYQSRG